MSGGTLAVGKVTTVGAGAQAGGTGTLVQTAAARRSATSFVLIGDRPGSAGTMSVSGGSTLTLTGPGATGDRQTAPA